MPRQFSIFLALVALCATGHFVGAHPVGESDSLAPMLEKVTPAVVNIGVKKVEEREWRNRWTGETHRRQFKRESAGSGLIINSEAGYVVTNHHVVENVEGEIRVTLSDRREFEATILGSDPETDVALLKIPAKDLHAVELGNSDDLRVGDFVVAIGNPFGVGQSATLGIISALGRNLDIEKGNYEDFIQTDASINPGNSGGPLVNLGGQVIGINTAIVGRTGSVGVGFAIPSNMVMNVVSQLVEYGEVRRGMLGIVMEEITGVLAEIYELESMNGVIIKEVIEGSSADKAGLKVEDVVLAIDGQSVTDRADLRVKIGLKRIGELVEVELVRNGTTRKVNVPVGKPILVIGQDLSEQFAGMQFDVLKPSHRDFDSLNESGVVVASIEEESVWYEMGIRKNDVITHLNRSQILSLDSLRELAANAQITGIRYYRNGRAYSAVLPND